MYRKGCEQSNLLFLYGIQQVELSCVLHCSYELKEFIAPNTLSYFISVGIYSPRLMSELLWCLVI